MSPIEHALFLDNSAHWVSGFDLSPEALVLKIHSSQRPAACIQVRFSKPRLVSVDDSYADKRELPWDIVGFESDQLPEGGRRFCLHTDCIEYVFESMWPEITSCARNTSAPHR